MAKAKIKAENGEAIEDQPEKTAAVVEIEKVENEINVESVSTTSIVSVSALPPDTDPKTVKVKISYPNGYKGPRILKNGKEYEVSPEISEKFKAKGIIEIDA